MDNSQQQQRPAQGAPGQQSLIRPEQVSRLPQLNPQQKQQYEQAVRKFWEVMSSTPPGEPRHQEAVQKLVATSQTLMQGMKNFQMAAKRRQQQQQQAAQAAQAAAQAGQGSDAQGQGQVQGQPQQSQNSVTFNQLLPETQAKVNSLTFHYPPAMVEGTKQAEDWLREAKGRYGQALQRMQAATQKMNEFKNAVGQRQAAGNPLNQTEQQAFQNKVSQCQKVISESQNFMEKFRAQQNEFRNQQPQHQFQRQPNQQAPGQGQGPNVGATPQSAGGAQGQGQQGVTAYSISDAVSAARNQQAQAGGSGQAGSPSGGNAPQQPNPAASATPIKSENQDQSVFAAQGQPGAVNAALPQSAGARPSSQPQSALQQHASQQNIHSHPLSQNLNVTKAPTQAITKNLQVTEARPVQMPPSRPTLSGGAGVGLPGQLAQPAIATLPGYVLEQSEDGRVLSKKKLNELFREVVGPGEEGEEQFLSPDAEEVS